jgi:hypothetical protein
MGGKALGATHFLPFLITGFSKAVSFFYHEPLFFFYGMFWFLMQGVLWLMQMYFQIVRPDPFCSIYHSFAYPSSEIYYTMAFATSVITWTCWYRVQQGISAWICIYLFVFLPPIILVFFDMNRWWEVLWTALLAIVTNIPFTLLMIQGVQPNIDYIENCGLMSWYGWHSTYFRRNKYDNKKYNRFQSTLNSINHLR